MPRVCEVCGQRYLGHGRCELSPVCPRAWGRRRELSIEVRRQVWEDFQQVLLLYALAVRRLLTAYRLLASRQEPEPELGLD